jgi:hypothetical protein
LATQIAREHGKPDHAAEARAIAEAELTILQARAFRARLLDVNSSRGTADSAACDWRNAVSDRGDAASDRRCSGEQGEATRTEKRPAAIPSQTDLSDGYLPLLPILLTLDRYEKTAALRRQRALRNLRRTK